MRLKIVTPEKRKFQFWVNLRTEILETKNILDSTNQEGILHKFTGLISTTSKFASSNTAALYVCMYVKKKSSVCRFNKSTIVLCINENRCR